MKTPSWVAASVKSSQTVLHRCYQSATFFVGKFQLAPTKDHDRYTGQDPDQNAKWITFDRHISGDRTKDRWDQSTKDASPIAANGPIRPAFKPLTVSS